MIAAASEASWQEVVISLAMLAFMAFVVWVNR